MSKILDTSRASDVEDVIMSALDDAGYSAEESIPGLVSAIYALADHTLDSEQVLDEAANLLADGVE